MPILSYRGMTKTDRYEILALLREAMKTSGSVELKLQERTLSCQFLHIDLQSFSIAFTEELCDITTPLEFVIKGSNERIGFTTTRLAEQNVPGGLAFHFPAEITLAQRRNEIRITIAERHRFFCEGRFRDGFSHRLRVKDLSRNGIGLVYDRPLPELTRSGMLLKNMLLILGDLGQFTVDLTLLSIKEITSLDEANKECTYHIFSCQFHKPSSDFSRKMEEIVMDIVLEDKRIKRLR